MKRDFEVISNNNTRYRFDGKNGYFFEFGIKPGTMDVEDRSVVYVKREFGDFEIEEVATFPNPSAVGCVDAGTSLLLRERQILRCPKCGFGAVEGT